MIQTNQLAAQAVANVTDLELEIDDPSVEENKGQVVFDLRKVVIRTMRVLEKLMTDREYTRLLREITNND